MNPFLYLLVLALFVVLLKREWRIAFQAAAGFFWPLFLPAFLAIAVYLVVHIEERYISPLCLIFSLLPLLPLLDSSVGLKRVLVVFLLVIYTIGAGVELADVDGPAFVAALHRDDFHHDPQWKLSAALPLYGLRSDDPIAIINANGPAYLCHWAYISNLRIVAEFGSLPWTLAPWDRTWLDHIAAEPADEDYGFVFWKKLTPEQRMQIIDEFHGIGARAVLALSGRGAAPEPGWQEVAGTNAWIYRFDRNLATAHGER
jgi:hypothetical protein